MKEKLVFVLGLKWFDKVNGNTYCRQVCITDNGSTLTMDYKYGYGDHYMEYAKNICESNGVECVFVPHTEKWVTKKQLKDINYL